MASIRLKKHIDSRNRASRLATLVQSILDNYLKAWFFYQYEKQFEKIIRNAKAQKIIDASNTMRLCKLQNVETNFSVNETRNADTKMKILRARAKSVEVIITHMQKELIARGEEEEVDEENKDMVRLCELKSMLKIKTNFQTMIMKSRY